MLSASQINELRKEEETRLGVSAEEQSVRAQRSGRRLGVNLPTCPASLSTMEENAQWRKTRFESCKDPNGWLTLAGAPLLPLRLRFP